MRETTIPRRLAITKKSSWLLKGDKFYGQKNVRYVRVLQS